MINIYVEENYLEIEGHAQFAEYGKDIVCAGITALFRTLVKGLEEKALTEYVYKNGYAKVQFTPLNNDAKVVFKTITDGMRLISENYPDHVNFVVG